MTPVPARAQESALASQCSAISVDADQRFCNLVAQAVVVIQPRLGLAAAGGNPVAGTASTVGMRVGSAPRVSVTVRGGAVLVETPYVLSQAQTGTQRFPVAGVGVDAAMGLLEGVSLMPTVGGVLSLDALASATVMALPGEFRRPVHLSWGLGGRVGLLRESFTMPGVSVAVMYRHLGQVTFGDPLLATSDGFFQSNLSMISLRGAASKRVYLFDVTAGLGLDRMVSGTRFGATSTTGDHEFAVDGLRIDRTCTFVDIGWTSLVWQIVGEVGWQAGAGDFPALLPLGGGVAGGAPFGSLAVRLTI